MIKKAENDCIEEVEKNILSALRRLIRAIDAFSIKLRQKHNLNTTLLACLKVISKRDNISLTDLSRESFLSSSTITSAIDKLEERRLVERKRVLPDRRVILISSTKEGTELMKKLPLSIHEKLVYGLKRLSDEEKMNLNKNLEKLILFINAEDYLI